MFVISPFKQTYSRDFLCGEIVLVFYFLTSRRRILFTNIGSEEDNFGNVICMMKYYRMTTLLRKKMKI